MKQHLIFPTFEDKGRLHVHYNKIKRGLLPGQSLSRELEWDRRQQESSREFCYSWPGLFNCWIGHNYPVPSSPLHAPRSGAHWPNRMEYFTPFPLETSSYQLFDKQLVLQRLFNLFLSDIDSVFSQGHFILRWLRNISFWDGSATFHFETAPQHVILRRLRNISLLINYMGFILKWL